MLKTNEFATLAAAVIADAASVRKENFVLVAPKKYAPTARGYRTHNKIPNKAVKERARSKVAAKSRRAQRKAAKR